MVALVAIQINKYDAEIRNLYKIVKPTEVIDNSSILKIKK